MSVPSHGDTMYAVAYALLEQIAQAEQWVTPGVGEGAVRWNKSRKEILDAYKECLHAVRGSAPDKYF